MTPIPAETQLAGGTLGHQPDDARGTALALRLVGNRVGLVGTRAAAGLLAGAAGVSAAFWLPGGLLAVAVVGARHSD